MICPGLSRRVVRTERKGEGLRPRRLPTTLALRLEGPDFDVEVRSLYTRSRPATGLQSAHRLSWATS